MPLVTVKTKFQVTIPRELRNELDLNEGDLLDAELEEGRIVLTPKRVVDRDAAFVRLHELAAAAEERWRADGLSDEEVERMIVEEVRQVRAERVAEEDGNG